MAPVVKRFLFEVSFDAPSFAEDAAETPTVEEEVALPPTFSQEEVDAAVARAQAEAHAVGLAEGQASEQKTTARLMALAVDQMVTELRRITDQFQNEKVERAELACEIALSLAKRFLPVVAEAHAVDEIVGMMRSTLAELTNEPKLTVRVSPLHVEQLSEEVARLAATMSVEVAVLADPAMGTCDARIEWMNGSIERDDSRFWTEVDIAAQRTLARRTAA